MQNIKYKEYRVHNQLDWPKHLRIIKSIYLGTYYYLTHNRWSNDVKYRNIISEHQFLQEICRQSSSVLPLLMLTLEVPKSPYIFLYRYLYHMLVEFEQNRSVWTTQNLCFLKNKGFLKPFLIKRWGHFERGFLFSFLFVCLFVWFVLFCFYISKHPKEKNVVIV